MLPHLLHKDSARLYYLFEQSPLSPNLFKDVCEAHDAVFFAPIANAMCFELVKNHGIWIYISINVLFAWFNMRKL